jgi:hypothetical protein
MPKSTNNQSDIVGMGPAAGAISEMLSMKYDTSVALPGPPGVRASNSPAKMMVAEVLAAVNGTVTVCQLLSRNSVSSSGLPGSEFRKMPKLLPVPPPEGN